MPWLKFKIHWPLTKKRSNGEATDSVKMSFQEVDFADMERRILAFDWGNQGWTSCPYEPGMKSVPSQEPDKNFSGYDPTMLSYDEASDFDLPWLRQHSF